MAPGDSGCEAYTAIAWGVGLSHERSELQGPSVLFAQGNMCGIVMRGADALPGSKAHHVQRDRTGSWEARDGPSGCSVSGTVRIGR